ncbi:MAG: hydrogenase/urease maturation nickel metallochaperone HypA [Deltaproteobacteria bacterium]|nr:hydrogenase/urease maturation nickel metallochaperone HypA [Deltaproteobacteria bacterium]
MHEWALTRSLIRELVRTADARGEVKIRAATVRIGALSGVSSKHLRSQFSFLARGTVAEGAKLRIEMKDDLLSEIMAGLYLESVEFEK